MKNTPKGYRTPEQVQAFKQVLADGGTIQQAKLAAGYSENVAKQGMSKLPRDLKKICAKLKLNKVQAEEMIALGAALDEVTQVAAVRGRLLMNTIEGTDAGTLSAKQLGADKRVSMWQPESITAIQVNNAPRGLAKFLGIDGVAEAEEA